MLLERGEEADELMRLRIYEFELEINGEDDRKVREG
jgi:hypothetical protein